MRDDDLTTSCSDAGLPTPIVLIDTIHGADDHNLTLTSVKNNLLAAIAPTPKRRCVGALISIRCRTWSVATVMKDANGNPGKPWRDVDNLLGIKRDGILPTVVQEANLESTYAAEIGSSVAKQGGSSSSRHQRVAPDLKLILAMYFLIASARSTCSIIRHGQASSPSTTPPRRSGTNAPRPTSR